MLIWHTIIIKPESYVTTLLIYQYMEGLLMTLVIQQTILFLLWKKWLRAALHHFCSLFLYTTTVKLLLHNQCDNLWVVSGYLSVILFWHFHILKFKDSISLYYFLFSQEPKIKRRLLSPYFWPSKSRERSNMLYHLHSFCWDYSDFSGQEF